MFRTTTIVCAAVALLALPGCYRGYKSAKELDSDERGPKACMASCKQLGLEMSAFVLVERQTSGCVCSPIEKKAAPVPAPVAAAATVQVVGEQQKQEAEQQRTRQPVVAPTP
jgi:hypothetical protein